MPKLLASLRNLSKESKITIGFALFWYVALFPGRLGYDYSLAIRMLYKGQSTDQWTSLYFWFFRVTTFNGRSIALASLISLSILIIGLNFFINSLPVESQIKSRTLMFMVACPLVGAFGVNVSHDTFLASGILIFVGLIMRQKLDENYKFFHSRLTVLGTTVLLMTNFQGLVVLVTLIIFALFTSERKNAIFLLLIIVLIQSFSGIGITKNPPSVRAIHVIADIKCVTQHPMAKISQSDWNYLTGLAPKEQWLRPVSCSWPDELYSALPDLDKSKAVIGKDLLTTYARIFMNNPLVIAESHLQRSRGALPPPFFQGPDNQVNLDTRLPVGYMTNLALQSGPGVLHPSIDEPSVHPRYGYLKPLELIAQFLMFIFNQASWFWGWGGLWLWPLVIFIYIRVGRGSIRSTLRVLTPVLALHAFLVFIGPAPLPRYVMSAVLGGITVTLALMQETSRKIKEKWERN